MFTPYIKNLKIFFSFFRVQTWKNVLLRPPRWFMFFSYLIFLNPSTICGYNNYTKESTLFASANPKQHICIWKNKTCHDDLQYKQIYFRLLINFFPRQRKKRNANKKKYNGRDEEKKLKHLPPFSSLRPLFSQRNFCSEWKGILYKLPFSTLSLTHLGTLLLLSTPK